MICESPIKWVGSKKKLARAIVSMAPALAPDATYHEPFLGSGAVFFSLDVPKARLSDTNGELINFFEVARFDVEALVDRVSSLPLGEKAYYEVRAWDRASNFLDRSKLDRAARFFYLNRTGFNGLWRISPKGYNNVAWNHADDVKFPFDKLRLAGAKLNSAEIEFSSDDFRTALANVRSGDVVYMDPPYVPLSKSRSFTGYTLGGFSGSDHDGMLQECRRLDALGAKFILSNSSAEEAVERWKEFKTVRVAVSHVVGGRNASREKVEEIIVTNFDPGRV